MANRASKAAATRRNAILIAVASLLLLVWVFPLIWAVIVSLKSESEVLAYPPRVIFEPTFQNYRDAVFGGVSITAQISGNTQTSSNSDATEILNLYAYKTSFVELNFGYGSALAVALLFITICVSGVLFHLRTARRG